jgi:putative hydrolase of the HAD superfamily
MSFSSIRSYSTLFFDLDDTLYPNDTGLWAAIRHRMGLYMVEKLNLPPEIIPDLRRTYYMTYGTTLRGLQKHHQVDADDYLAYVHDLPLKEFILPNPELSTMLTGLHQRCFIFTNADAEHARRVMELLGVEECFDGIIDVRAIEFACKPEPVAYQRALALGGDPEPSECIMLDDSLTNLAPAQRLGFTTVLVGKIAEEGLHSDYTIPSLLELPQVLPGLWNGSFTKTTE